MEVAVWSKPCGRYRALSCGGRRSRHKPCDIQPPPHPRDEQFDIAVSKNALLSAPKWWLTITRLEEFNLLRRRDLNESGACVPLGEGCVLLSAVAASKAAAAKRRPRRRQERVRPSEGTPAADSSRAALGPHRPTVGSRPRTLSAEEKAITMRRRDIVADRYDGPNTGTPADGRLRKDGRPISRPGKDGGLH